MKTIVLLIYLIFASSQCLSRSEDAVLVGDRLLVGDSHTFKTLSKMSIGGHEIKLSRWQRKEEISKVMQTLTSQLPNDTIAWSDGEQLNMQWTSSEQSYFLIVFPVENDLAGFLLSSIDLSIANKRRVHTSYVEVKTALADSKFKTKLIMDVTDDSTDFEAATLIYASLFSTKNLEQKVREFLKKNNWTMIGAIQHPAHFPNSISFEAMRFRERLRFDLVGEVGRSFLHVNLSGAQQP